MLAVKQTVVTMDLETAAKFLRLHPNTLQERAKQGIIPGAKIGKEWVFIEVDLLEYIRSQYKKGETECRSTKEQEVRTGGTASQIPTGDQELGDQLAKLIEEKRSKSTIKRKRNCGKSKLQVVSSTTR